MAQGEVLGDRACSVSEDGDDETDDQQQLDRNHDDGGFG